MTTLTRVGPAVTDVAGELATAGQLELMYTRYSWAREHCRGARVIEVGCGTGLGLGALSRVARSVVGSDYSWANVGAAKATYGDSIPLASLDAQRLAFRDGVFDVALLFEVLYFLPNADAGLAEIARVLRPGGTLLLSVINPDTPDFATSPLYPATFGVVQLADKFRAHGFEPRFGGALPVGAFPWRARVLRPVKRLAARLNLIPNTVQARIWLKRIVFGSMSPIPRQLEIADGYFRPVTPLPDDRPDRMHQLLLCAAVKR